MHIVITGANGFVGRALAQQIGRSGQLDGRSVEQLSLLDLAFDEASEYGIPCDQYAGDLANVHWLKSVLAKRPFDVIFHLASIPGGMAENNYDLARAVNLTATQCLLELAKAQVENGGTVAVFVFASSIAVFGKLSQAVTDTTATQPQMTYGAQKVIGEVLVHDFSRRGWVDGRSLRLPGVLARPPDATGQLSAFLSDMIRELAAGHAFVCPMSPEATTWASSLPCVVDNLIHGATLNSARLSAQRTFNLPTMVFSMQELVDAIAQVYRTPASSRVTWQPEDRIESLFGRFPALETPAAHALGFLDDGKMLDFVRRALA